MIIAETNRLVISKISLEDAPFFLKLVNTPNWIKYIGDRNLKTIKDAEVYLTNGILKSYKELGFGFYKLQNKFDNESIGICGLVKREQLEEVDFGFAFLPEFEGQGFGFEASTAILKLAQEKFQLKKLLAITLPINSNSVKLLEKLGFTYEKKVKPFEDDEELLLFAKQL
ncbi:GNAT family N-acetyltransferase [Gaetbulibacter sp. M235]|uniref:GNAT family N-acetyltransferase n=1 Tax=Gaetbulibacter sp. M235 TaxID=3126510 RepID=UPI00374E92DB